MQHGQFVEAAESDFARLAKALDDDSGVQSIFDEVLHLLEDFACKNHNRGGPIPDLGILILMSKISQIKGFY